MIMRTRLCMHDCARWTGHSCRCMHGGTKLTMHEKQKMTQDCSAHPYAQKPFPCQAVCATAPTENNPRLDYLHQSCRLLSTFPAVGYFQPVSLSMSARYAVMDAPHPGRSNARPHDAHYHNGRLLSISSHRSHVHDTAHSGYVTHKMTKEGYSHHDRGLLFNPFRV